MGLKLFEWNGCKWDTDFASCLFKLFEKHFELFLCIPRCPRKILVLLEGEMVEIRVPHWTYTKKETTHTNLQTKHHFLGSIELFGFLRTSFLL